MLFDLRGRGRRRAIQVIYASLAILMGGGLVFFGIGGNTSGGLFDAFSGSSSTQSADELFKDRVTRLEQRTKTNPGDAKGWADLAGLRFQVATTGENYDQARAVYTQKGKAELRKAEAAWDRYLQLDPAKPDARVANLMVQAFGDAGLKEYEKAVAAQEIVIEAREPTPALYAQLAILAHAADQDRKSTLSQDKALELAPKAQRKDLETQIKAAKAQIDAAASGQQQQPSS